LVALLVDKAITGIAAPYIPPTPGIAVVGSVAVLAVGTIVGPVF